MPEGKMFALADDRSHRGKIDWIRLDACRCSSLEPTPIRSENQRIKNVVLTVITIQFESKLVSLSMRVSYPQTLLTCIKCLSIHRFNSMYIHIVKYLLKTLKYICAMRLSNRKSLADTRTNNNATKSWCVRNVFNQCNQWIFTGYN